MSASWGTELYTAYSEPSGAAGPSYEDERETFIGSAAPPSFQQQANMSTPQPAAAMQQQSTALPPRVAVPATNRGAAANDYPFYAQQQQPQQQQAAVAQPARQQQQQQLATYVQQPPMASSYPPAAPSYMDKFWNKRREVVKLASLSLVVVLALALHQWITFVVDRYVSTARLTLQQETILRLSYPVFVLFFLWHLKAQSAKAWTD